MSEFSDLVESLGPVGWWRLGETPPPYPPTVAADSSGRNHDGVYHIASSSNFGQPGAIANDANKAVKVVAGVGTGDYAEISDSDDFSLARANDGFDRTVYSPNWGTSWGNADHGGAWTAQVSTGNYYQCNGSVAKINQTGGTGTWQQGLGVSRKYYELQVRVSWSERASGDMLKPLMLVARMQDTNNYYRAQLNENTNHTLDLLLVKVVDGSATTLATATNLKVNGQDYTYSANDWWYVRFRLDGETLSAKAWKLGDAQPTTWNVSATDSHFDSAGTVAIRSSNSGSNARPVVSFDDFWVQSLGMTVHLWMRPDELDFTGERGGCYIYVLGKGINGQDEWAIRFYPLYSYRPNRVSAYIWNLDGGLGAGAYFQEEDALEVGQWYQFVAVFDPGDALDTQAGVTIYKDGEKIQGPPSTGTLYGRPYNPNNPNDAWWMIYPKNGTAPLRFGTRNLVSFFTGALDEVAIFDRKLTDYEICCLYRKAKGQSCGDCP